MIIKYPVGDYRELPEDLQKSFKEAREQIDKTFNEQIATDRK
tara:strand:+ start:4442 stop:4567 length:126 start_codon:yes stop_codon:yes gene_type:complete